MIKKIILVLLAFLLMAGAAFADKNYKHHAGDMLFGLDIGAGLTPNAFNLFKSAKKIKEEGAFNVDKGNYAVEAGLGLHLDYYTSYWLSFSTGARAQIGVYAFLDRDFSFDEDTKYTDIAKTPFCVTIPLNVHINLPFIQWLYAGAGVHFNIPINNFLKVNTPPELGGLDTKGKFFIGVPVDLGFDFIPAGRGGVRLFFRATPEFHDGKTVIPVGIVWQVFNLKIR